MHKTLEKDLKSRKSVSDGRKETKAPLATLDGEYQRHIIIVATMTGPHATLIYGDLSARTLAQIILNAPKAGAKGNPDLPDMFNLSTMKDKATRARTRIDKVLRACAEATKAMPTDKEAGVKTLDTARDALDKRKVVDRIYREAAANHRKEIDDLFERARIEWLLTSIA